MLNLVAKKREIFGKKLKFSNNEEQMPAVMYGNGKESKSIFIPTSDFLRVFKGAGESAVIELEIDGKKENVLILELCFYRFRLFKYFLNKLS